MNFWRSGSNKIRRERNKGSNLNLERVFLLKQWQRSHPLKMWVYSSSDIHSEHCNILPPLLHWWEKRNEFDKQRHCLLKGNTSFKKREWAWFSNEDEELYLHEFVEFINAFDHVSAVTSNRRYLDLEWKFWTTFQCLKLNQHTFTPLIVWQKDSISPEDINRKLDFNNDSCEQSWQKQKGDNSVLGKGKEAPLHHYLEKKLYGRKGNLNDRAIHSLLSVIFFQVVSNSFVGSSGRSEGMMTESLLLGFYFCCWK